MLRLAALVFSALVLLTGCTEPPYRYSKAGSDVDAFRRDSAICVQAPGLWNASENPIGAAQHQVSERYRRCMEARGWTAEAPR